MLVQKEEREFYDESLAGLKAQVEEYRVENTRLLSARQRAETEAAALSRQYHTLKKEYDMVPYPRPIVSEGYKGVTVDR